MEFFVWSRAGLPNLDRTVCCLEARPGSIWWQKMDAGREYAGFLVVLRTSISTIKMQSTANLGCVLSFVVLVIVRYVRFAFRDLSAAALRDLRRGHGQDRKAAPNRIAPARLRLQVRRLQPDYVGRAGAAGQPNHQPHHHPAGAEVAHRDGPAEDLPATAALIASHSSGGGMAALERAFPVRKNRDRGQSGFLPGRAACKASAKLLVKKRQGHVRGLH
jgi:hypothetical protein